MISMKILDVKSFMSSLLIHSVFDELLLCELDIATFNQFHISGKLIKDWFSKEELEERDDYSKWEEIKPYAFQIMKGTKTPTSFKVVLQLQNKDTKEFVDRMNLSFQTEDINGLFINIRFENNELHLITGTSIKAFTLDKSFEHEWDSYVRTFLKNNKIPYEEV